MLAVTARLFKDNQLVGYRLSDGIQTRDFTKKQVWLYAKNKQIMNVVATGTEQDPGISGTGGFELKSLPTIKQDEQCKETKQLLGTSLLVMNVLYDGMAQTVYGSIIEIGYRVKNIGNQSIAFSRIEATPDGAKVDAEIKPGEELCLSKTELLALGCRREVGMYFANGRILCNKSVSFSFYIEASLHFEPLKSLPQSTLDIVKNYLGKDANSPDIKMDIRLVEKAEIIDKYFCPPVNNEVAKEKENTVKKIQSQGLFNGFKR